MPDLPYGVWGVLAVLRALLNLWEETLNFLYIKSGLQRLSSPKGHRDRREKNNRIGVASFQAVRERGLPFVQKLRKKLLSEEGKIKVFLRHYLIEPIFGHLKFNVMQEEK